MLTRCRAGCRNDPLSPVEPNINHLKHESPQTLIICDLHGILLCFYFVIWCLTASKIDKIKIKKRLIFDAFFSQNCTWLSFSESETSCVARGELSRCRNASSVRWVGRTETITADECFHVPLTLLGKDESPSYFQTGEKLHFQNQNLEPVGQPEQFPMFLI